MAIKNQIDNMIKDIQILEEIGFTNVLKYIDKFMQEENEVLSKSKRKFQKLKGEHIRISFYTKGQINVRIDFSDREYLELISNELIFNNAFECSPNENYIATSYSNSMPNSTFRINSNFTLSVLSDTIALLKALDGKNIHKWEESLNVVNLYTLKNSTYDPNFEQILFKIKVKNHDLYDLNQCSKGYKLTSINSLPMITEGNEFFPKIKPYWDFAELTDLKPIRTRMEITCEV